MKWEIWEMGWDGQPGRLLCTYYNRGHAVARLKGLRRLAWKLRSEVQHSLRRAH